MSVSPNWSPDRSLWVWVTELLALAVQPQSARLLPAMPNSDAYAMPGVFAVSHEVVGRSVLFSRWGGPNSGPRSRRFKSSNHDLEVVISIRLATTAAAAAIVVPWLPVERFGDELKVLSGLNRPTIWGPLSFLVGQRCLADCRTLAVGMRQSPGLLFVGSSAIRLGTQTPAETSRVLTACHGGLADHNPSSSPACSGEACPRIGLSRHSHAAELLPSPPDLKFKT